MKDNFFSDREVCGRKAYKCHLCQREIPKGARHVHVTGCTMGDYWAQRAHVACHAAAVRPAGVEHSARNN